MTARKIRAKRKSRETNVELTLALVPGNISIQTGIGFLDHMITSLAHHAGWSLNLTCEGDLIVDEHHSVEDCAITLGLALARAVEELSSLRRFGSAYAPMDESLARAVVDCSGRPWHSIDLGLQRDKVGDLSAENALHFFESLAINAKLTLHIDVLKGTNDHHRLEAAFKALALALGAALSPKDQASDIQEQLQTRASPSTKGNVSFTLSVFEEPSDGRS
jgi:imidazoleglycerol phosphate dehydratase HisB